MRTELAASPVGGFSGHGLTYIENSSTSPDLVVFLHGLGLDADDYRDYLSRHDEHHSVAVTLRGFDANTSYSGSPISLSDHVRMVADLVEEINLKNPGKRIHLVGFSLGADLILRLAEHWRSGASPAPPIAATLLLDRT
ncbi:alpha/beta fold hydrolase [Nonomuraea mesophila]|uniref:Alpha/beta fold hydrolase n=1 Tax=Nonomuraea mesophila TaxID=2530382 RepID=A0A4R5EY25_9ACTN|nr:alpha/beta fold hydrolase [Nonomuraea mesophila]TDE39911.1 alpha/beta fold hydrolase [Nonomuraea mesophila]